ncbi:MAG TPA: sigma-70 family RNA polymerase sigma factor [Bacteroidales bacterium]|nr:sigma-70 family RNA polymerase sigma factor [Bacteroidales bacterium]
MLKPRPRFSISGAASASLSDDQLIAAYVDEQNTDYFGVLFERYTHLVFGVCMKYLKNRYDAEDAVMAIFEKLMTDLKKHEVRDFKNWLYKVSKNHCLMILRRQQVKDKADAELIYEGQKEFMEMLFPDHHNSAGFEDEGILISLRKALDALKTEQRICVEMMYLHKKSYKEIAEITGFSLMQVKSYIQNGKRNLQIMLVPE